MVRKALFAIPLIVLFAASVALAQQAVKKEPATKMEQFLAKKGKVIVKDSHEAGVLKGQNGTKITVSALTIYEPGKETDKIRGLRIEVYEGGRLERSTTSFLDIDEVDSLSQAITSMMSLLEKQKGNDRTYIDVIFSTRGDFNLGLNQKGADVQAFAKSGMIGAASCYFPSDELTKLKAIVDNGNSLLAQ